jgi:hypothetical protein
MGAQHLTNWAEIEKLAIAGVSIPDLARRFALKPNSIRVRAARYKWPTPLAIAKKAKELEGKPTTDLLQVAAEDWVAKGEAHRKIAFEVASASIKKFQARSPKNFRELKAADDVARRSAGLDLGEANQQTLIMMHERLNNFDEQPEEIIEGEVLEDQPQPALSEGQSEPALELSDRPAEGESSE